MEKIDMGEAFKEGWIVYKENFGLCICAAVVAVLIGSVSCGICTGPMLAGLFMMLRRLVKKSEPKPVFGDLFKGFDLFLPAFLLMFLCGIAAFVIQAVLLCIPVIGWLLFVPFCFVSGPIITWALMLVANRGMKWTESVGFVVRNTFNGKFLLPILLGILAGVVGGLGGVICGVGAILTFPYSFCVYAAAYEQVFGSEKSATDTPEVEVVA